jgi:hypothetical protein
MIDRFDVVHEELAAVFEAARLPSSFESLFELRHSKIGYFGCEPFDHGSELAEPELLAKRCLHRAKGHEQPDLRLCLLGQKVIDRFVPTLQLEFQIINALRNPMEPPDQFLARLPALAPLSVGFEVFVDMVKDNAELMSL